MSTAPNPASRIARVAVVTVSYGSEDVLGPFLNSLIGATTAALQIVVADNKPSVGSNEVAALSSLARAQYLPLSSNQGYGHAINQAVRTLPDTIEWVVISNPDVTLHHGAIDVLLAAAGTAPSIAAIGPRILSADGQVYPSARAVPSLRSGIGHAIFSNFWPTNPWTRTYRRETHSDLVRRDAGWLSGACLMVRRSVLDQLNGFDESYFMYFEDVDLGYRIGKLGLRNVYEPSAVVVHTGAHSTSTENESARMIRAHHTSAEKFLFKKYSGAALWPVRIALRVGLNVRARLESGRSAH